MSESGSIPLHGSTTTFPNWGGDTPIETVLAEMGQAGFSGTELGGVYPRDPNILGPLLADHGLAMVAGWWDGRILEREVDEEFDALLPYLILHRDLNAACLVYADTSGGRHDGIWQPISARPKLDDTDWAPYGRKLTALAERMSDFGVPMAFHHHMGTIVETNAETQRLMSVTGEAVGLLYDSGHSEFSGGDPVALAAATLNRIVHVHCKDVRAGQLAKARADDASFMDSVLDGIFTVPGDGSLDFAAILGLLHDAGYDGWLIVEAEQDPARAHPLTYATMGHDNLSRLARAAGFDVIERGERP